LSREATAASSISCRLTLKSHTLTTADFFFIFVVSSQCF
jgi:hypothetical protein